jgi:hypothetical protein
VVKLEYRRSIDKYYCYPTWKRVFQKFLHQLNLLESSTMTQEESEEIHNQLSKLENQFNELRDRSIKKDDLINTQRKIQIWKIR